MEAHKRTGSRKLVFSQAASAVDLFAPPYPGFNFRGRGGTSTWCGILMSLVVYSLMAFYGYVKFKMLLGNENPNIVQYEEPSYYDDTHKMSLLQPTAQFAFALIDPI